MLEQLQVFKLSLNSIILLATVTVCCDSIGIAPPLIVTEQVILQYTDTSLRLIRVDVRATIIAHKNSLKHEHIETNCGPSTNLWGKECFTTDDKLDAVGGFTAHLNEVYQACMEHVKRTASSGHATPVLYTREASVEMKNMLIDNHSWNTILAGSYLSVNHHC